MYKQFIGKKVAILGLGIEGLSSLRFFKENGSEVDVKEKKEESEIDQEVLEKARNYTSDFKFGLDYLQNLLVYDIVVRSPSLRPDTPQLLEVSHNGVIITSNTKIFFDLCVGKIIGITCTKGKGTTTALIGEMLKKSGFRAFVGGNIGRPPLDFVHEIGVNNWAVLEMSSFQLIDMEKSPHVAVVLMVTSEHLEWHKDTTEYIEAKMNIVSHQEAQDFSVINVDYQGSSSFSDQTEAEKLFVSIHKEQDSGVYLKNEVITRTLSGKTEPILSVGEIFLRGRHNIENISAAAAASSVIGVRVEDIAKVAREFKGLPHRLEFIVEVSGVKYYNDSFSTTPETAIAALKSFTEPLILILGGSDKGSNYSELGKLINEVDNIKEIILIGDTADKIEEYIDLKGKYKSKVTKELRTMSEIVSKAKETAKSGDVVLLSPASASFGLFKNYKDRGEQFSQAIRSLKD